MMTEPPEVTEQQLASWMGYFSMVDEDGLLLDRATCIEIGCALSHYRDLRRRWRYVEYLVPWAAGWIIKRSRLHEAPASPTTT